MRSIHKEKKNRRSGFDQRIRWYQESDGVSIRIQLEDSAQKVNAFPTTKEAADHLWFMVTKQCMTEEGGEFISDLKKLAPPEFGFCKEGV